MAGSSPAMTMETAYAHDSVIFAPHAIQWQNYSQVKPRQPVKAAREEFHATFGSHARHCRTVRRARRAMAAANARREPPQPSVPDLGAVRGTGAELVLRRIP